MIQEIINILKNNRFPLQNEKATQQAISEAFLAAGMLVNREYWLDTVDKKDKPDFYIDGIAIEVKIKGTARNIFAQLQRYSESPWVKYIILVTAKPMGLPKDWNSKPLYMVNINSAWL